MSEKTEDTSLVELERDSVDGLGFSEILFELVNFDGLKFRVSFFIGLVIDGGGGVDYFLVGSKVIFEVILLKEFLNESVIL